MSHAGPFILLEHFKPRYPLPARSRHCSQSPGPPPGYGTLLLWAQGSSPSSPTGGDGEEQDQAQDPPCLIQLHKTLCPQKHSLNIPQKSPQKPTRNGTNRSWGTWGINTTPGVWEDRDWITSSKFGGISLTYTAAVTKEMTEFKLVINFKGVVQLLVLCGWLKDRQKFLSNALGQQKQVFIAKSLL